jgi:hypothetical protein
MNALLTAALGLSLPTFAALAQTGPCLEDFNKFCADVEPGNRKLGMQCLKQHGDELSQGCNDYLQAARAQVVEVRNACKADMEQFCADIEPRQGLLKQCLKEHQSEVSPDCQAALAKARGMRKNPPAQ